MSEMLEYAIHGKNMDKTAAAQPPLPNITVQYGPAPTVGGSIGKQLAQNAENTDNAKGFMDVWGALMGNKGVVAGAMLGALTLRALHNDLKKSNRHRAMFESLCWDPEFASVDKGKLLEWYTTIYRYSPTTALDKTATKELLKQFNTFGRVDMQTLKTLADTEEALASARSDDNLMMKLWK